MTFAVIENSNDEGRPISLYQFSLGSAVWRYSSADQDIILNGYKWVAVAISDDGVKLSGESAVDALSISAPSTIAPFNLFTGTPPSQPISVAIYNFHEGDTDAVLGYLGEVLQVDFNEPGTIKVTCDTISVSMQRDGLRLGWQRACPYALYDKGTCNADKESKRIDLVVIGTTANTVTVIDPKSTPSGTLDGGFIEWDNPRLGSEWRGVELQTGNVLTMFGLADGLYYGLKLRAYPGCNRTTADCNVKFNNLDNYGGVPDLPGKSPFDGDPVF